MENQAPDKWYFRNTSLVVGFLVVGPFILPLVWANPHFSKQKKIIISSIVILLSCLLFIFSIGSLKSLVSFYQQANNVTF